MKVFCFLVGISACGLASAQLPPGPIDVTPPGKSVLRPEYVPANPRSSDPTAAESLGASRELKELIRIQTEAIRTLSSKVDSLDERLRRIESRMR